MADIQVAEQAKGEDRWVYRVTVGSGHDTSNHDVTLEDHYYRELTDAKLKPDELVKRSFDFLLEREPKEAILRSFNLKVIQNYFPEYENTVKRWIS